MAPTSPLNDDNTPTVQYVAFGLGHVLNDLVACAWFSFFLVYLTHVLQVSDVEAGMLLFIGQMADALSTPLTGMMSDTCAYLYGFLGRKLWLATGYLMVGLTNPLLYIPCPVCSRSPGGDGMVQFWYLAAVIVLMQFGWSVGQVSHLALLTDIGRTQHCHTVLNSIRFGATVCSNLVVFLVAFILLSSGSDRVSPSDAHVFRWLAYCSTALGVACGAVCLAGVQLPSNTAIVTVSSPVTMSGAPRIPLWQWLLRLDFWEVGTLYMCARVSTNVAQVYLQLYVLEALQMPPLALAVVPSTFFAGQMVASLTVPQIRRGWASEAVFMGGLMFICSGSALAFAAFSLYKGLAYLSSIAMGIGCGVVMVVSLALVADLASSQRRSTAGILGLISFADKAANAVAFILIQRGLQDCGEFRTASFVRRQYILGVFTLVPVSATVLAFLVLWSLQHSRPKDEMLPLLARGHS
eukprot:GGOE01054570.1.p1 GENE.GGOE01054570.1~~GGOE01054570.1.p1  ORF type:complete len:465 (+),score=126.66 GGOE01054570.1:54-1448(+)